MFSDILIIFFVVVVCHCECEIIDSKNRPIVWGCAFCSRVIVTARTFVSKCSIYLLSGLFFSGGLCQRCLLHDQIIFSIYNCLRWFLIVVVFVDLALVYCVPRNLITEKWCLYLSLCTSSMPMTGSLCKHSFLLWWFRRTWHCLE